MSKNQENLCRVASGAVADSQNLDGFRSSATGSLTDSLTEFTFQFGRRYHSDRLGNYAFPNDDVSGTASSQTRELVDGNGCTA